MQKDAIVSVPAPNYERGCLDTLDGLIEVERNEVKVM